MTLSVAEEANAFSAGNNRACSNGESREDKCGNGMTIAENRVGAIQPICYRSRQREKLLCLWRFWVYGPLL